MTIAQAFNEITVAQGGTPNNGGTITGAIDALNDTLAGSDQEQGRTIEDAVRLLGQHIGGGGSSVTVEALTVTENDTYTAPEGKAYSPVTVNVAMPTATIYFVENYDGAYRQPQGTISVNGTPISSTTTSECDGETVYGYIAPLGSLVEYERPSGTVTIVTTLDIFGSVEDMVAYETPLLDGSVIGNYYPVSGVPLVWVDLTDE